jgi:hypothetical protein
MATTTTTIAEIKIKIEFHFLQIDRYIYVNKFLFSYNKDSDIEDNGDIEC